MRRIEGASWRGVRNGQVAVWLGHVEDAATAWTESGPAEAGHGLNVRLEVGAEHVHLVLGCGTGDEAAIRDSVAGRTHDAHCLLRA